jgi:hypothetical protein
MAEKALDRSSQPGASRRTWTAPRVEDLPHLTELTLVTGPPVPGGVDIGGGSTIF